MTNKDIFKEEQGIFVPLQPLHHRDEEYTSTGFDVLLQMQRKHFWYRGRHQLLLNLWNKASVEHFGQRNTLKGIDMGGGCGGWLEYLSIHAPDKFAQLALGDSSIRALSLAEPVVGSFAKRYQIDLLNLPWHEEWDVVFLLDVLEHIPDHRKVLKQIYKSMRKGGLLFVTTPALQFFWSYNDDLANHQRRYNKQDFQALSDDIGFKLLQTNYFMFFLSPILFLHRIMSSPPKFATPEQLQEHIARTHQVPMKPINELFTKIFLAETSLINHINFPWGTSILAIFQR